MVTLVFCATACTDDTPPAADPTGPPGAVVSVPPLDPAPATVSAWVGGPGRPLADALVAASPLAGIGTDADPAGTCADVAAALDAIGTPQGLRALADEAPDTDARTLLLNDLTVKVEVLATCAEGVDDALAEEVAFSDAVVRAWLEAMS